MLGRLDLDESVVVLAAHGGHSGLGRPRDRLEHQHLNHGGMVRALRRTLRALNRVSVAAETVRPELITVI